MLPRRLIVFEAIAVFAGAVLVLSHQIDRIPVQRGVLLGIAAGLGFGIADVAIKALSGDLDGGPGGLLSPWTAIIASAAIFSFYASARSLQIGDGVAVIAVTQSSRTPAPATRRSDRWLSRASATRSTGSGECSQRRAIARASGRKRSISAPRAALSPPSRSANNRRSSKRRASR